MCGWRLHWPLHARQAPPAAQSPPQLTAQKRRAGTSTGAAKMAIPSSSGVARKVAGVPTSTSAAACRGRAAAQSSAGCIPRVVVGGAASRTNWRAGRGAPPQLGANRSHVGRRWQEFNLGGTGSPSVNPSALHAPITAL